jgi:hypothetical protein
MFHSDALRGAPPESAPDGTTPSGSPPAAERRVGVQPGWLESSFELAHGLDVVEADGADLLSMFQPTAPH